MQSDWKPRNQDPLLVHDVAVGFTSGRSISRLQPHHPPFTCFIKRVAPNDETPVDWGINISGEDPRIAIDWFLPPTYQLNVPGLPPRPPLLKWPSCGRTAMSLCLLLAELWMEYLSSHHHLEHHRVSVYSWRIMHPPMTLPQVNVQWVVFYPAGHLILGIWLNFTFNYPVLCRAIEDSR